MWRPANPAEPEITAQGNRKQAQLPSGRELTGAC